MLSARGLCDGLVTFPEKSYRMWCVVVCDLETSWMRRPWPSGGLLHQIKKLKLLGLPFLFLSLKLMSIFRPKR